MPVQERVDIITMKGKPLTLIGDPVEVDQDAPDCALVANDLSEVKLSSFRGRSVLLSVVPSLDTAVCDLQTKRFNKEAANLKDNIKILTISMDLPFAQARWCGATGSDKIQTLSDHRDAAFGQAYGVLVKGVRLLARSIFIIDEEGKIKYVQLVNEITDEPDYETALNALKN